MLSELSEIFRATLGEIHIDGGQLVIQYNHPFSSDNPGMWPGKISNVCHGRLYIECPNADGIPNDGIPIEEVVTVSTTLTVIYGILAVAGLVFAVFCLLFTLIFRNRK